MDRRKLFSLCNINLFEPQTGIHFHTCSLEYLHIRRPPYKVASGICSRSIPMEKCEGSSFPVLPARARIRPLSKTTSCFPRTGTSWHPESYKDSPRIFRSGLYVQRRSFPGQEGDDSGPNLRSARIRCTSPGDKNPPFYRQVRALYCV